MTPNDKNRVAAIIAERARQDAARRDETRALPRVARAHGRMQMDRIEKNEVVYWRNGNGK